ISEIENTLVAFAFTNGTWFQMIAPKKLDTDKAVLAFTHGEPFLRRTFKGTTEEMRKLVLDGLAGKGKLPPVNQKEAPGFGPEVAQGQQPEPQARAADLLHVPTSCCWFVSDLPLARRAFR